MGYRFRCLLIVFLVGICNGFMVISMEKSAPSVAKERLPTGDISFKKLVQEWPFRDAIDEYGMEIIHHAVLRCPDLTVEDMELLVRDYGANIRSQTRGGGDQAIHFAGCRCNLPVLVWLVSNGADVNAENDNGERPIHYVARLGDTAVLETLVYAGKKYGNSVDIHAENAVGAQAIHYAAQEGRIGLMCELVELKASISVTDNNGWQPIHYAARAGHEMAIGWLLCRGSLTFGEDSESLEGTLESAHVDRDVGRVTIDTATSTGEQAIHIAARSGHIKLLGWLHKKGARVNAKDACGWEPIHHAAHKGHFEVVQWLIAKGAVVDSREGNSYDLACLASGNGHVTLAKYLREYKARIAESDQKKRRRRSKNTARDGREVRARSASRHEDDTLEVDGYKERQETELQTNSSEPALSLVTEERRVRLEEPSMFSPSYLSDI